MDMNDRNKVFVKKNFVWANRPILDPKWHILITLDPLQESFKTSHNEKVQWVDGNSINNFFQKGSCLGQIDQFGPKNGPSS